MTYGFAPSVLPCQIPNAKRDHCHGSSGGAPAPAPAPAAAPRSTLGWAIGGFGDSTDTGGTHDPHKTQQESTYESIFVPSEDQPIYSNMKFASVSTLSHEITIYIHTDKYAECI